MTHHCFRRSCGEIGSPCSSSRTTVEVVSIPFRYGVLPSSLRPDDPKTKSGSGSKKDLNSKKESESEAKVMEEVVK